MAFTESGVTLTSYFALKSDWSPYLQAGGAVAVGNNSYGQLGFYDLVHRSSPIAVVGGAGWLDAAVLRNGLGTTFVSDEGSVYFSGMLNTSGFAGPSPIQNGTLSNWSKISSSPEHSLAIKTDGTLWSWGRNDTGSLGLSDTTDRSSPVQVGTLNNWTQISACGYNNGWFSFAIQSNGTLWAWGSNSFGNLGINTSTSITSSSPVQVGNLSDWYQISGGQFHTMAIKTDGTLWGWGNNSFGQLGTNTSTRSNVSSPVQIGIENSWYEVEIGAQYTMSIKTDGTLWAWGNNSFGPLGLSNQTHRSSPVQVGTSSDWRQVTAGQSYSGPTFNYTLAIKTDGTLWSWGYNQTSGSLGLSDLTNRSSPVQVGTLSNWSQVFAGAGHSLAIKTDGTLWAWGNNGQGQLGLSDTVSRSSPVQVGILSNWNQLTGRGLNSTAIKTDNTLWVWGFAPRGLAGTNYFSNQNFPRKQFLGSFKKVTTSNTHSYFQDFDNQIAQYSTEDIPLIDPTVSWSTYDTGLNHFVGIKTNGTAWSIGSNLYGQCGFDTQIPFKTAHAAGSSLWLINTNGTLWSCGYNNFGQLGLNDRTSRSSPVQVGNLSNWSQISGSTNSVQSIKTDGTLWVWGYNISLYMLNTSVGVTISSPVQVGALSNWAQVGTGSNNFLQIKTDGTLWASGDNGNGQLGLGDQTDRSSPTQIGSLSNWSKLFTAPSGGFGAYFSIKTDGTLWAWGYNTSYQTGTGAPTTLSTPVQVGTESNWATVGPGDSHTAAIKTDGTLWTWGGNSYGQLGNIALSLSLNISTPIQVGSLSNWAQVACGLGNTFAIKTDGTLWSCGYNTRGQLGLGDTTNRSSLVQIGTLSDWVQTSGRLHTAAINSSGNFFTFGSNSFGQLGTLDTTNRSIPVQIFTSAVNNISVLTQIGSNTNWTKAIAADFGSMLIDNSYNAFVFGENDNVGQLGLSDTIHRSSPVQITYTPVITASMDDRNAWLIDANNNIWQSGVDNNNYFGIGQTQRVTPVQVGSLSNWSQIDLGYTHSLSIKTDGTLWGWG
jgi:alpha-tubulin suppressor-like RCC1 family protein